MRARRAPIAALLTAAILLCVGSLLLGTSAQAQVIRAPYATSTAFTELTPGEAAATFLPLDLPVQATVTSATLKPSGRDGAFLWTARLCEQGGTCTPVADTVGRTYAAGTYQIELAVVASDDLGNGEQGSVAGRLTFVGAEDEDQLAVTGAAPGALAVLATLCAVVGLGLLIGARRRSATVRAGAR